MFIRFVFFFLGEICGDEFWALTLRWLGWRSIGMLSRWLRRRRAGEKRVSILIMFYLREVVCLL